MRFAGKITEWNDDRGFGFVVPNGGGDRAFVHISEVRSRGHRPSIGDQVTYSVAKDSRGRLQAKMVAYPVAHRATKSRRSGLPRVAIGVAALVVVLATTVLGRIPVVIGAAYVLFSLISFFAYANDKRAAKRSAWRTREGTLHMLDLLGGWPGGLIAQQEFHHKTVKGSFQAVFWLSVAGNIGGVLWLTASGIAARVSSQFVG